MEEIDNIEIKTGGSDFETVPEGMYDVQITNIKKVEGKKYMSEEVETKILFEFTILDGEQSGQKVFQRVRPVLSIKPKPSKLYELVCAATGKKLTEGEFKEFHLSPLKDLILSVVVVETEKNGTRYNNIASFLKKSKKE
jgi:hypothetical protein